MSMQTHLFRCLSDNYGVLVHDPDSGETASIDVPEEAAVRKALADTGWSLTHILITHHHNDHIGGLEGLKTPDVTVVGPKKDAARIPGLDVLVGEGDTFEFGGENVEVFETPGHTSGHITYYMRNAGLVFAGDTMFTMGCGRLFEGTPADMWTSLNKITALPASTKVFCGHEYTLSNARFAVTADPTNEKLKERLAEVEKKTEQGIPTVPTTVGEELETNPFVRAGTVEVAEAMGLAGESPEKVLAEVRRRKDSF
ncbi:MAG: hydroxyacylglutathione hydrolase [Tepidamorphaceae bacterium]